MLQPELLSRARATFPVGAGDWMVFTRQFGWLGPNNVVENDICMPYKRSLVLEASGINIMQRGYLSCYVGQADTTHQSQRAHGNTPRALARVAVRMPAHRLLCHAFHGVPAPDPENPQERRKVVMHKCNNPSCLNPGHIKWASQWQNMNNVWDSDEDV